MKVATKSSDDHVCTCEPPNVMNIANLDRQLDGRWVGTTKKKQGLAGVGVALWHRHQITTAAHGGGGGANVNVGGGGAVGKLAERLHHFGSSPRLALC